MDMQVPLKYSDLESFHTAVDGSHDGCIFNVLRNIHAGFHVLIPVYILGPVLQRSLLITEQG